MSTVVKDLYHLPALDAEVEAFVKQYDNAVSNSGEHEGLRNKPGLLEEDQRPYCAERHHEVQAMIYKVATRLQPTILISQRLESEKITARLLLDLQNKLNAAKERSAALTQEVKGKVRGHSNARLWIGLFFVCLPLIPDGLLYVPSFQLNGLKYFEAVIVCLGLSFGFTALAHFFKRIVAGGKTLWHQRARAVGIMGGVICVSYVLADMRTKYLNNEIEAENPHGKGEHIGSFSIVMVSLFLFVIAICINTYFFPNAEQRKITKDYNEAVKSHTEQEAEVKRIEAEIEALKRKHEELVQINDSIYIYGYNLQERLIAEAKVGYAKWCRINLSFRPDQGMPISFKSCEYPFNFTSHFKKIEF